MKLMQGTAEAVFRISESKFIHPTPKLKQVKRIILLVTDTKGDYCYLMNIIQTSTK